jgi:predicted lipoprotein with Yx(FWY)xxD motif
MPALRFRFLIFPIALLAALALAACGSDSSSTTDSTTAASASSSSGSSGGGSAAVDLADNSTLGTEILVDAGGNTLYMFEKDDSADESYCYDACAKAWPPLTSEGAASAGSGLDSSQLTTFQRDDGSTQLAYAGHPLYTYAGDTSPGDANGNDLDQFGATWYALDSSGATVEGDESGEEASGSADSGSDDSSSDESTTTDDTSGGSSYSY